MTKWSLLVVLLWLYSLASAQVLNGEVVSVQSVDSCTLLPRDDLQVVLESQPGSGAMDGTDGTVCGVFGEDTAVTTVVVDISANQVASQDNLVFTIPGPPNAGSSATPDGTDCYAVLEGQNCVVYETPVIITIASSNIVTVHPMKRNVNPVAYASYWVQSGVMNVNQYEGAKSARSYFTKRASLIDTDITDKLRSPFTVRDSTANVGRSGILSVCPSRNPSDGVTSGSLTAAELEYYPYFPDQTDPTTGAYRTLTTDPLVLFCPTLLGAGSQTRSWQAGYVEEILFQTEIWDIGEAPKTMFNAKLEIGLQVTDVSTGATSVQSVSSINLSTLQDGAEVVDNSGLVMASMLGVNTLGPLGQPIGGSIQVTAACVHDSGDPSQDPSCKNGLLTDYAQPVAGGDFDFVYTTIPMRDTEGGKAALAQKCPIPMQRCRQIMFQDDGVRSQWSYIKPLIRATGFGKGCSKNGQGDSFYGTEPAAAELMCSANMNGKCIIGYEQTGASQLTSFAAEASTTACQVSVDNAILLDKSINQGESVSYTGSMFADFNQFFPQQAVDGNRLIVAVDGDASITASVVIKIPATFYGEEVTIATGTLMSVGMQCGTPDDSASGYVQAVVKNTGTLAGSFIADATFDSTLSAAPTSPFASQTTNPDPPADPDADTDTTASDDSSAATYVVTSIQPCTVSLNPQETGTCLIQFSFSGPIDSNLIAHVTLKSGTVVNGRTDKVLAKADVGCLIGAKITDGSTFGSESYSDLYDPFGHVPYDPGDACTPYLCIFCSARDASDVFVCTFFWLVTAIVLLFFFVGTLFFLIWAYKKFFTIRLQAKAVKGLTSTSALLVLFAGQGASAASVSRPIGVHSIVLASMQPHAIDIATGVFTCATVLALGAFAAKNAKSIPTNALAFFAFSTAVVSLVNAQGIITDISSYQTFAAITDADGNTLVNDGGFVTTVTLDLSTAVQGGLSSTQFSSSITVVPNEDTEDSASPQTSGTTCTSNKNSTCQSTTPVQFTFSVDQAVLNYRITPVEGFNNGYSQVPYNYYYNAVTEIVETTDVGVTSVEALTSAPDSVIGSGFCSLIASSYTGSQTPFPSPINITAQFNDPDANTDHMRCPTNAQPPMDTLNDNAPGAVEYLFTCQHFCTNPVYSTNCLTTLSITANFQPMQPMCKLWSIDAEPSLSADVKMTLTNPTNSINETVTLGTVTSGLQGAVGVTTPEGLAAFQIFGVSGGSSLGPSIGAYLITCTSDGSDLNMVPEGMEQVGNSVPSTSLSFNPYREIDTTDTNPGTCSFTGNPYANNNLMPEPCTIERMTGESDPFAMMFIVNNTDMASIGTLAGQLGVDRTLYAKGLSQLEFVDPTAPAIPMDSLIPLEQGGTGNFENFFTGVPLFGRGFLDLKSFTCCTVMSDQRTYQDNGFPPNGAIPPPFMPLSYKSHNRPGNIWTRTPPGGGAPLLLMEPSSRSYNIKATMTATIGAIEYRTAVPQGTIDGTLSSCRTLLGASIGVDGNINYQVCNENSQGKTANYQLSAQCGLASTFNTARGTFDQNQAPTAQVLPPSRLLEAVSPGECRNAKTDGALFFEMMASTEGVVNGTDSVFCVLSLDSEDTEVPSQIQLQSTVLQCGTQLVNSTASTDPYLYAPLDTTDPRPTALPTPTPSNSGLDLQTEEEVALIGFLTLIVLALVAIIVVACACFFRSRSLSKKLKNPKETKAKAAAQ